MEIEKIVRDFIRVVSTGVNHRVESNDGKILLQSINMNKVMVMSFSDLRLPSTNYGSYAYDPHKVEKQKTYLDWLKKLKPNTTTTMAFKEYNGIFYNKVVAINTEIHYLSGKTNDKIIQVPSMNYYGGGLFTHHKEFEIVKGSEWSRIDTSRLYDDLLNNEQKFVEAIKRRIYLNTIFINSNKK